MTTPLDSAETYPRQQARTRRFSLGRPRDIRVAADGSRITFLRSRAGDDPVNCLWAIDTDGFRARLVVDPRQLAGPEPEDLPPAERARRERARESGGGIVAY
ncbi:MAG TPA: S9 family peptidase, partial [Acidimicrobiales bacterium]